MWLSLQMQRDLWEASQKKIKGEAYRQGRAIGLKGSSGLALAAPPCALA
jgi:plasmid maintenance system antidote protein VapI